MSLKKIALIGAFFIAMLSISVGHTATDWDDLSFKLQLEKTLVQESRSIVEAVLPKSHYFIVLSVTLEGLPQGKNTNAGNELNRVFSEAELKALTANSERIYLDKLGGWTQAASVNGQEQARQRSIQKIDVTLGYDESLDIKKVEGVKKNLEFLYKGYSKTINLQLEKQQIYIEPEKVESQLTTKDWIELVKEPLTYFIIALMGLFGYIVISSKRINVEKEKVAAMTASAQGDSGGAEPAPEASVSRGAEATGLERSMMASGAVPTQAQDIKVKELISKVEHICAHNIQDLKSLIKEFIAEESLSANCALTFLATSLTVETLKKLTSLLTVTERSRWKKVLIADFDLEKISLAQQHLGKSISQFYLEEDDVADKEVREMMKLLSPRDAAQILKKNSKVSAFVFNNLSPLQLTRVVALLDADVLSTALKDSMQFIEGDHRDVISLLKTELQEVKSKNDNIVNPFLEKSFNLIKDVPLAKEEAIFAAVASTGQEDILSKMSVENLPASLILDLPQAFIVTAMSRFKLERRVEFILSRNEQDKNKLLSCFGATGKNREIIDVEIQTVSMNQIKMKTIEKNKDILWSEFVKGLRTYYRSFSEEPTEIEELRNRWVKDCLAKNRGSSVVSQAS